MNKRLILMMVFLPLLSMAQRHVQTLENGWRFYQGSQDGAEAFAFKDSSWKTITVPHSWNTDIVKNQVNAEHFQGDGWYRLQLPELKAAKGKRLFLRFEGALAAAEVYLNGKGVGRHEGGYTAFCFEITDVVNFGGNNLLAVRVNNEDNPSIVPDGSRLFPRFGGIYRPVHLIVTEPGCITPLDYASSGVYVHQENVSEKSADLSVNTKLSNGWKQNKLFVLRSSVMDAAGKTVAENISRISVKAGETISEHHKLKLLNPHLWNGRKDPYLYSVKVELIVAGKKVDEIIEPLGVRYFVVDSNLGVMLNGKPYPMYGVCRHQDWEHEATALTDEHHRHDVEEIMEVGATTVRLAHYPQSKTMYNLCDTNGLIVWAEIPVVQGVVAHNPKTFTNAKQQLVEMIRQNYNHPSIFFWGLYNENWIKTELVAELHRIAKEEDPVRLTTAATHQKEVAERHLKTDLICWNKYPKWYGNFDLGSWADKLHVEYPDLRFGISEYGAGGCVDQHELPPPRPNPTKGRFFAEEYMNYVHEEVWPMLDKRPFLWGTYLWNMFDFGWPGVTRGSRININNKGLITYDRQTRKDPFYYYKSNWSDEPVLYITSRRFVNRTKAVTPVKVYSNCDGIELKINGAKMPAPESKGYGVYLWPEVQLKSGENSVSVVAVKDGKPQADECVWVLSDSKVDKMEEAQQGGDNSIYVSSAKASSEQVPKGYTVAKAIDGNPATYWCAADGGFPQWITLDLLQSSDVSGISILWGRDDVYSYEVQISDDAHNWKTVVDTEGSGQACTHRFKATTFFIRVLCKGAPENAWACIREIKVFSNQM